MKDPLSPGPLHVLRQFVDIALLRRGPSDLPASPALLLATVVCYVAFSALVGSLVPAERESPAGLLVALDSLFVLAWYWVMLRIAGRPERYLQTATAIFGFQLVAAPFVGAGSAFLARGAAADGTLQLQAPALVVLLGLAIWMLVVTSRILKAATEWPLVSCVSAVLAQGLIWWLVLVSFLQPGGA